MDIRDLIVVDVETTGLEVVRHVPIEVAAVNVRTGDVLYFVPFFHPYDKGQASDQAMHTNRYYERGVYKDMLSPDGTADKYEQLWEMLGGNTLGGANARFDAAMLRYGYSIRNTIRSGSGGISSYDMAEEPWHYRLADLGSYAAGVLGSDPGEIPSLSALCAELNIENPDSHSALGDARAAAECFRRLGGPRA